jgi:homocysteine S-methyltransferase
MINAATFAQLCRESLLVLDGGLATELERRGHDLSDSLWSARVLRDDPAAIEQVHYDYYAAGARVAITATYQVTYEGCAAQGLDAEATTALLRRSVDLACAARTRVQRERGRGAAGSLLVAASVGPYGAMRHDGSEYRGDYGIPAEALADFHRRRFGVLAASGADVLACETIPSLDETRVLLLVLREHPEARAWMTFTARDGNHIADGSPIAEAAELLDRESQVVAVGVNCVAPDLVPPLLESFGRHAGKPLVAYPNAGDAWDAVARAWIPAISHRPFASQVEGWVASGAVAVGGCCRTTPDDIRAIAAVLSPRPLGARGRLGEATVTVGHH